MFKVLETKDTGKTFEGHAAYDYLIANEAGEQRWLQECILLDIEDFTDEDWEQILVDAAYDDAYYNATK